MITRPLPSTSPLLGGPWALGTLSSLCNRVAGKPASAAHLIRRQLVGMLLEEGWINHMLPLRFGSFSQLPHLAEVPSWILLLGFVDKSLLPPI